MTIKRDGGKGNSLINLKKNGFNVPEFIIIETKEFFTFLKENNIYGEIKSISEKINKDNYRPISNKIRKLILKGEINLELILPKSELYAVRSSAVSEDSAKNSFAGMFSSFLNVKSKNVNNKVRKCWASLFNERAVAYKLYKKLPLFEGMAVVVQKMINADTSGVIFTLNPEDKETIIIETVNGLGDKLVSGRVTPKKNIESRSNPKSEIAKTALIIEKLYNKPQDIEFCIEKGKLWILQSRPLTGENNGMD